MARKRKEPNRYRTKEEKLKSIKIIFNGESSVQVAKNMNYLVGC